jgi:hypothetical protein
MPLHACDVASVAQPHGTNNNNNNIQTTSTPSDVSPTSIWSLFIHQYKQTHTTKIAFDMKIHLQLLYACDVTPHDNTSERLEDPMVLHWVMFPGHATGEWQEPVILCHTFMFIYAMSWYGNVLMFAITFCMYR